MERLMKKFGSWKFDKKMYVFISAALSVSVGLIMAVSVIASILSITRQSQKLVEEKVQTMTANTEVNFEQYQGIFWALMMDSDVQTYLQDKETYAHLAYVQEALGNAFNMWDNMNFIGVISSDGNKSYIKGNSVPNSELGIQKKIMQELNNGVVMSRKNTSMRTMAYNTAFSKTNKYSLMMYQPIFSDTQLDKYIGMAYINISDSNLDQLLEDHDAALDMNSYFVYGDGTIISCGNEKEIGTGMDISLMKKQSGHYWESGYLYVYQKLKNWNYLYVTSISIFELCKDSIFSIIALIAVMLFLLLFMLGAAKRLIRSAYRPWGNVADTIEEVTHGDLKARLDERNTDPDMERIILGFNGMMEKIICLMEQVKEEQRQMDQIRFEALQSQIQPHFLYNTLDCIHWQAAIDGNREISNLVKALASYYRICLSKGREVITLMEELDHIRNYLYIQQMRYGDILTYDIENPKELGNTRIPKLTLQPLVENSIYHGIKVKDGKQGHVTIRAEKSLSDTKIIVEDSGNGMAEEQILQMNRYISEYDEEMGYGVRNVNRRIELLYGENYGLYYKSNTSGGITVEILIPGTL